MEIALIVALGLLAIIIAYPKRAAFWKDRAVMATGWCPRCYKHTVISPNGDYLVCTHCHKR